MPAHFACMQVSLNVVATVDLCTKNVIKYDHAAGKRCLKVINNFKNPCFQ